MSSHQLELASAGRHAGAHQRREGAASHRRRQSSGRAPLTPGSTSPPLRSARGIGAVRRGHVPSARQIVAQVDRHFRAHIRRPARARYGTCRSPARSGRAGRTSPRRTCGTAARLRANRRDQGGNLAIVKPAEGRRRHDDQRAPIVPIPWRIARASCSSLALAANCGQVRRVDLSRHSARRRTRSPRSPSPWQLTQPGLSCRGASASWAAVGCARCSGLAAALRVELHARRSARSPRPRRISKTGPAHPGA